MACLAGCAAVLSAQDRFDVASVHPSRPGEGFSIVVSGNRFFTRDTSVQDLIDYAYMLHGRQIVGGPAWIESEKFDVDAESDRGEPLPQPVARTMVQQLLAERFHFSFHRDRKEMAIYEIVQTHDKLKLTPSRGSEYAFGTVGFRMLGEMNVKHATMVEFANFLQRYVLDRPVLDHTGIEGRYDLELDWTADETQFYGRGGDMPKPDRSYEPPDLFTAFREQLGLRLAPKRDLAPVLVVDRVDKPGGN